MWYKKWKKLRMFFLKEVKIKEGEEEENFNQGYKPCWHV
jgi:hypothetical protein